MTKPLPAVAPARPDEQAEALHLLFRDLPPEDRDRRVASALELLRTTELDPAGLLVEHSPAGLAGVIVCLPVPGASALFWPPRSVADTETTAREDRLIRQGLHWVRSRGAKLSQSLLTVDEVRLAAPLLRNGFRYVTRLWYLATELEVPVSQLATPSRLDYQAFDPANPDEFQQALLSTYEGTRDCPEISGIRTIEEVILGHQAQGNFNPSLWWLVRAEGRAAGVLMVTVVPDRGDWDVSYIGVVPEARRHRFGKEMMLKAIFEAKAAGAKRVTLSVDGRNLPALQLYRSLNFAPYDVREVYLAIWR